MESDKPTLIFISGLGADGRTFDKQMEVFENSIAPDWIPIRADESLEEYAVRLADSIEPKPESCYVIGLSFGGMITPYVAKRLGAKAAVLIASVRSPRDFPNRYRVAGFLAKHFNWLIRGGFAVARIWMKLTLPIARRIYRYSRYYARIQLSDCTPWRFAQVLRMLTTWGYSNPETLPEYDFPIYHLHGDRDHLLPLPKEGVDEVVPHCGHLIPMSHPEETNRFLREKLDL